jgi:uncharacterized membrane protein
MNQAPMNPQMATDVTEDDKLWAALGYPIPIVAIIVLLMEDKRARDFIKFHAFQSLALWVVYVVIGVILSVVTFGIGGICVGVLWLAFFYAAYLAYKGQKFEVPVVTNFLRNQGWVQ